MDTNKISFITCISDEALYQKSLSYINNLQIPKGIEIEIIAIRDAKSLTAGYNQAIQKSDSKYKVYLHQDVYIQNINFIRDILNIFKSDSTIGLIGMIGAKILPTSGIWWDTLETVGKVIDTQHGSMKLVEGKVIIESNIEQVKGIDGLIMITQYDLPWREDLFDGWHFYDISQCVEFTKKNLKIVVPNQETCWCIHDCGYSDTSEYNIYEKYRAKFLDNYSKDIFPLVSILIPTYNQTKYLGKTLDSALNQSYRNTEIIICDDSTTEDVQNLIKEYMKKSPEIKYFNNGGPAGFKGQNNIRKCLEAASGEYISYLFHDDLYSPNRIDRMVNYFLCDDTLSLVTSYRKLIDENGNYLGDTFRTVCQSPYDVRLTGEEAGKNILFSMINYIGELTTAIFKKKALTSDLFDYDEYKIHCLGDISLWLKLLRNGNMIYISEPLSKFRVHSSQNTNDLTLAFWAAIDFFNMIISSYENKLFIKTKDELLKSLMSWYKEYAGFLIQFSSQYNNNSKENNEIAELRDKYLYCYTRFINILLE